MPRVPASRRPIASIPTCWRRRRWQVAQWLITESPTNSRIKMVVVFFVSFERLSSSLSYLLVARSASILVESLPYICRVIFCILFSLGQNQIVDLMVLEDRLDSIWVSNVLNVRVLSDLVGRYKWFSKVILSYSIIRSSVHQMSDKEFRCWSYFSIFQV